MHLKEAQFSTLIIPWLEENIFPKYSTVVIEYKKIDGCTFNIKSWKDGRQGHQYSNLKDALTDKGVYYKMPDVSKDTKKFDAFYISKADESFLIIWSNKLQKFAVVPFIALEKYGNKIKISELQLHSLVKRKKRILGSF